MSPTCGRYGFLDSDGADLCAVDLFATKSNRVSKVTYPNKVGVGRYARVDPEPAVGAHCYEEADGLEAEYASEDPHEHDERSATDARLVCMKARKIILRLPNQHECRAERWQCPCDGADAAQAPRLRGAERVGEANCTALLPLLLPRWRPSGREQSGLRLRLER